MVAALCTGGWLLTWPPHPLSHPQLSRLCSEAGPAESMEPQVRVPGPRSGWAGGWKTDPAGCSSWAWLWEGLGYLQPRCGPLSWALGRSCAQQQPSGVLTSLWGLWMAWCSLLPDSLACFHMDLGGLARGPQSRGYAQCTCIGVCAHAHTSACCDPNIRACVRNPDSWLWGREGAGGPPGGP